MAEIPSSWDINILSASHRRVVFNMWSSSSTVREQGKMEGNLFFFPHVLVSRLYGPGHFQLLILTFGNIAIWQHFACEKEV